MLLPTPQTTTFDWLTSPKDSPTSNRGSFPLIDAVCPIQRGLDCCAARMLTLTLVIKPHPYQEGSASHAAQLPACGSASRAAHPASFGAFPDLPLSNVHPNLCITERKSAPATAFVRISAGLAVPGIFCTCRCPQWTRSWSHK